MNLPERLREIAAGPASNNSEHADVLNVLTAAADEIERLQAIEDAAEAFLAVPPDGMADRMPFAQYTTAGDCRELCKAMHR